MPKSRIEIAAYDCCIPLTKRQWERLERLDNEIMDDGKLFAEAIAAGVMWSTIEYNGHFGRNFFFRAAAPMNTEAIEEAIYKVIGKPR